MSSSISAWWLSNPTTVSGLQALRVAGLLRRDGSYYGGHSTPDLTYYQRPAL